MPIVEGKQWSATDPTWHPGTQRGVEQSLQQDPLGNRAGEKFDVPANYRIPDCRVYAINHSRTRPWKRIAVAVSAQRGAEDALVYDKKLAQVYNVDTLIQRVIKGQDMNRYVKDVKPVAFSFSLGGRTFIIPPAMSDAEAPPRIEVPEGAWDLFMGNYDRMNPRGNSSDEMEKQTAERVWISKRWKMRANPVFSAVVDGKPMPVSHQGGRGENEFGFIEFVRETQHVGAIPLDRDTLRALDMVEV
jgi:hypothetical protein